MDLIMNQCHRAALRIFHDAMARIVHAGIQDVATSVSFVFFAITPTNTLTLAECDNAAH